MMVEGIQELTGEMMIMDEELINTAHELFEEGNTLEQAAVELEMTRKDLQSTYDEWKQMKMDKLNVGDKVCFILNMAGHDSQLVHGNIHSKHTNAVVIDCAENAYVKRELKGRVAVSVKDVLKV